MSENLNRGSRDFSQYDTMETEELEQILRLDAEALEGAESDTELLVYIMEVLASRRNNSNITGNTAQEAWESFQKNYMPEDCLETESTKEPKRVIASWVSRMIATAAVVALVVAIPITAKAFGLENIWNVIAHWTKETFSFVSGADTDVDEPNTISEEGYTSLQDALKKSSLNPNIVPTWVPEEFVLEKIEKVVTPIQEIYRAFYMNGEKTLEIRTVYYISKDIQNYEVSVEAKEVFSYQGIDYYIFSNLAKLQAIWFVEDYEVNISGDLSTDEIKSMIESIEKG